MLTLGRNRSKGSPFSSDAAMYSEFPNITIFGILNYKHGVPTFWVRTIWWKLQHVSVQFFKPLRMGEFLSLDKRTGHPLKYVFRGYKELQKRDPTLENFFPPMKNKCSRQRTKKRATTMDKTAEDHCNIPVLVTESAFQTAHAIRSTCCSPQQHPWRSQKYSPSHLTLPQKAHSPPLQQRFRQRATSAPPWGVTSPWLRCPFWGFVDLAC